jgi:GTP-binding protein
MDVTTGITDLDDDVIRLLRKSKKHVIVVVNKVDNNRRQLDATEFYAAGFEDIYFVSSITGSGTGELLDRITELMPEDVLHRDPEEEALPKFAIVGQPNVGKSTLLNALTGQERNIVTEARILF